PTRRSSDLRLEDDVELVLTESEQLAQDEYGEFLILAGGDGPFGGCDRYAVRRIRDRGGEREVGAALGREVREREREGFCAPYHEGDLQLLRFHARHRSGDLQGLAGGEEDVVAAGAGEREVAERGGTAKGA